MLHQVFRSIPDTDRRWAASGSPLHNQANDEDGCSIEEAN